ncbi:YihY family inner membrane protein [Magnetovibrio blakemorei]|uniref:UPF0761 membrane protein BEN30_06550 n=1 Tax=Magnetovibrio blakemorei TaxID=28181 RepID=A0A1E5Q9Q4_9PROT|nr:YihY family inner membrane protein [Magnetovibrio blakemorei]OEJ68409.1 hypothetical protein BEN30_06550 [Magnetovibrio blakemorei]
MRLVMAQFRRDQCMRIAAALSYTTLLALVPLIAIAFAILRAFPIFDDIQVQMKGVLFENFLPESVNEVQVYFDQFVGKAGEMTAIGIVGLAITAIMMLSTIEAALNSIFHVKATRPFVPRLMMFWAVITLGPLLLGGSLSLATYLYALSEWAGVGAIPGLAGVMARLLPSVLAIFAFTVFYAIVPYRPVKMGHALIGGITAGLLFGVLRRAFAFYISTFPSYQTIYGALATVPIFFIWMYLSWAVVLIGAQVTALMPEWGRARIAQGFDDMAPARKLDAALAAMEKLWRKTRGEAETGPKLNLLREDILAQALEVLREKGFVALSDRDEWLLCRDPDVLSIADVAHGLGLAPNPDDLPAGGPPWRGQLKDSLGGLKGSGYGRTLRELFESEPA